MIKHYKSYQPKRTMRHSNKGMRIGVKDLFYLIFILLISSGLVDKGYQKISTHTKLIARASGINEDLISPLASPQPELIRVSPSPTPMVIFQEKEDSRVTRLRDFLEQKHSPLAPHAQYIVQRADEYDIGWTKIVAISRIESHYGTKSPEGSHNAWGIMWSGKFAHFDSWEEGIDYASDLLAGRYKELEVKAIKKTYCPASDGCNPKWSDVVLAATDEILENE